MKTSKIKFIFLLGFAIYTTVSAAYPCPEQLSRDQNLKASMEWLMPFRALKKLGSCEVEITVCNPNETAKSSVFAEVFIQDELGREIYLPLSVGFGSHNESFIIKNKRLFHYQKKDRFYEEELGRVEVYRLEMLTEWRDFSRLKRLELGVYATNRRLLGPGSNRSHWFICEK